MVTIQPTIQRPFVKKWLRVSLLLWMFYEVMWMLFDSTADRPVILPSAIEYLTDFAVCATQTFFCFLLIRVEIRQRILFASRRMTLSLLLSILFLLNMAVAVPITWVEIGVYGLMDSEKWSLRDHLLNDMVLSMVSTLLLALQLVIRYVRERYRVLGADRVETRTDGGKYIVRIPILYPTHAYEDTDH